MCQFDYIIKIIILTVIALSSFKLFVIMYYGLFVSKRLKKTKQNNSLILKKILSGHRTLHLSQYLHPALNCQRKAQSSNNKEVNCEVKNDNKGFFYLKHCSSLGTLAKQKII